MFLESLLQMTYPIIQAPMAGGIVDSSFVVSVSDFGMLGSIPTGYLSLEDVDCFIKGVKSKTKAPFMVNLFVEDAVYPKQILKPQEIITLEKKMGVHKSDYVDIPPTPCIEDILECVVKYHVPYVSTTFHLLSKDAFYYLKKHNIIVFVTVNHESEAQDSFMLGADGIIFQTKDAGGHKGGFSNNGYGQDRDILSLKGQWQDKVFIKSGGIISAKDVRETLKKGYHAAQIGTGFLMTKESQAHSSYKSSLLAVQERAQTILTKSITGKPARGIKNTLATLPIKQNPGYPLLHYATKEIRDYAKKKGWQEYQSLWAGANVYKIQEIPSLQEYMTSLAQGITSQTI